MKKKTIISCFAIVATFLLFTNPLKLYALNYTITFTGSGASTTITNVIVQNLTKGTTVTVPSGNVLNLTDATTDVEQLSTDDEYIRIYPSLSEGKSTLAFFAKQAGNTQINAFGIDGRKIAGITANLPAGANSFQLSLPSGSFVIQVSGYGYTYTTKIISQSATSIKPELVYIGTEKLTSTNQQKSKSFTLGTTTMPYTTGDQLLYKSISGNYNTIVTDVPTDNKTINFNFVACTDADGNNYTVVTIGTQTWMAENLKTTKYKDGTSIPLVSSNSSWAVLTTPAYCWYNNNVANKNTYGALYNWYTVNTAKLAPTGWHIPTNAEKNTLESYVLTHLGASGSVVKSLAATTNWSAYTGINTIGNNLSKNNSSGFSALPSGFRYDYDGAFNKLGDDGYWWTFDVSGFSQVWPMVLSYYSNNTGSYGGTETLGFSVRCVRN